MLGGPPKDGRERLGSPLDGSRRVRRPSWRAGKHLQAYQEGREESGVVGRPTRKAVSDWEDLPEGREESGDLQEGQELLPEGREGLEGPPGGPGEV